MADEFDFGDLAPIEVPCTIGGKKYTLREASGDAACKYRNALLKATKLGTDGKPTSIDGMADAEPLLVSLCLFTAENTAVPVQVVRSWPQRIQKRLFDEAKRISQLDERDTPASIEEKILKLQEERAKLLSTNGKADPNLLQPVGADGSG